MILTTEIALKNLARALKEDIAPALGEPFMVESARLAGLLLTMCTNWVDDAAALRVAENAGLRKLLGEGFAVVPDADLAAQLRDAAASADPGLKVTELDAENERLKALLVRLHACVELLASAEAQRVDRDIWRFLEQAEAARAPRR